MIAFSFAVTHWIVSTREDYMYVRHNLSRFLAFFVTFGCTGGGEIFNKGHDVYTLEQNRCSQYRTGTPNWQQQIVQQYLILVAKTNMYIQSEFCSRLWHLLRGHASIDRPIVPSCQPYNTISLHRYNLLKTPVGSCRDLIGLDIHKPVPGAMVSFLFFQK